MQTKHRTMRLTIGLAAVMAATLACLGGSSGGGDEGPDLAATQRSLEATQQALSGGDGQTSGVAQATNTPMDVEETEEATSPPEELDFSNLQSGDVMYSTEFDGPGDWEDGWIHFAIPESSDNYDAYLTGDSLYLHLTDTNANTYVIYDSLYLPRGNADVLVETYFDNVGTIRNNNISLVCRVTEEGWYEFSVSSSGLWYVYKYTFADGYLPLKNGGVPGYNKNVTDHVISATCIGDQLNFFFDGMELKGAATHDSQFREGSTGVSVSTFNVGNVEIEFLWFQVLVP